jgi:glucose/arabinose dehydrogenase
MKRITFLVCLISYMGFGQTFGISSYATGFSNAVEITNAGDSRLFVVQKTGAIRIIKPSGNVGVVQPVNFMTIPTSMLRLDNTERGLLGLAFHPNYASNGYFYVNYTRASDGATVVARYSVTSDPDIADLTSGLVMLVVSQPFENHNGGTLRFGPDGYLYIGMGDGGSGGDPGNRAQNINENLGKMLRLDVNAAAPYIPASNPFVGTAGNDEIWALGLRNPWKFSFNRLNGDLWIADVGQGEVEEVDKVSSPLTPALNFGWRCYEGNSAFNTSGCAASSTYRFPLADYTQSATGGCAVTGGYYYTGSLYPSFNGKYIFGDYCLNKIFTLTDAGVLTISPAISGLNSVTTFGQDVNGELYVVGGNSVYRIIDTSLGVNSFAENGFSLYPNPAAAEVSLLNSANKILSQFKLYDLSGKLLLEQKMNDLGTNTINTGSLRSGLYVATVEDVSGAIFTSKLMIK